MSTTAQIDNFLGEYRFLSNFYPHTIIGAHGIQYPTAEAASQAGKTTDRRERERIAAASTPNEAKRLGQKVTLIPGWNERGRHVVMRAVLRAKFSDPELASRLVLTGEATLVEGNSWHDQFWGDCRCRGSACERVGENWLGQYLMALRMELAG
ncbi:NADAR family protein [Kutzneria sp. 744]|uniref:NADAR family protein n=1 Tax=Kutzneria sp. (strain 744) TaxID=345341 RepID=UPI0003EECB35|nr:NADAR family protein [Kutzneria sp. 744]EWM19669.1 hypothetical protein KUTG_09973 [Kutzneria sp. 744]